MAYNYHQDRSNREEDYDYASGVGRFPFVVSNSGVRALNGRYTYEPGDLVWLLACTSVTWIMLPGVGFFYSGLSKSRSSLSLFVLCLWSCAVASVQWWLIGYSLCLSSKGGYFIGNIDNIFLRNIDDIPSASNPRIPAALVGVWYCLFAAIAPTVFTGAIAERARFIPTVTFMLLWTTLVFDFLIYWTWNEKGWSHRLGTLDFGGGTPVHVATGSTALAYALMVGKRKDPTPKPPHNMMHVLIGTAFIWMGWLVANAGSGFSPNLRAVSTFAATNLSASSGGITWGVIDYIFHGRKWSPLGFCCGVVAGLVAVTPASGFISGTSSVVFGICGSISCNIALSLKQYLPVDDAFDVFGVHGVGAIVGNLLTGIFAEKSIAALDGTTRIKGGGLYDGNWSQVGIQAIDTFAGLSWAFFISVIILCIINNIPGLGIRAKPGDEEDGLDESELGYRMYEFVETLKDQVETLEGKVNFMKDIIEKKGFSSCSVQRGSIAVAVAVAPLPPVEDAETDPELAESFDQDQDGEIKHIKIEANGDINGNV